MSNRQFLALAVTAAVLYVVWRHSRQSAAQPGIVPTSLDWAASPAQDAAWWSIMAIGVPSAPGAAREGAAKVTPGTLTQWLGNLFPGYASKWGAPNAATNPVQLPSNGPAGALVLPGPVSPAQPTPQSAVESSSPWLPANFSLPAPVSSMPWATELTLSDPIAALGVAGGDFIDAVVLPAGDVAALRTINA